MSGDHAICPDCGAENLAGAKFCGTCGKDLAGAAAPATPAEPSPAQPGGGGPKKTMLGMTAIP
ncbi:MAG: zinc ribbon domain-containing protein, partial [Actinobacteria bacterium]|nr:zinc ribbon domain-containing protein [Actinomycetota bacterium]NIU66539.1 zinc ribbon domain-containing protein [Actinomycetota bacterium]